MRILVFLEKALPVLFWILLSFSFDLPYVAILTGLATLIHELGHVLCIVKLCGFPGIKTRLNGPKLKVQGLSYKKELLIALSGPLANLAASLALTPLFIINGSRYILEFLLINALTAALNLIPIVGFDGYKALYSLLSICKKSDRPLSVLYHTSIAISALFTLLALFFILRIGEGYWIFALFFSVMLSEMAKWQSYTI